ncbi:MAG: hypothetical protein KDA28_11125 [Phycisphaerales bacterium]|nr:hypothetical protein [Phycisphaerales bacterium]
MLSKRDTVARMLASGGALIASGAMLAAGASMASASSGYSSSAMVSASGEMVELIFRDGRTVSGEVLEETATYIRVNVKIGSLSAPARYELSDILAIKRGAEVAEADTGKMADEKKDVRRPDLSKDGPSYYVINLDGKFARDISPTPFREAVADAQKYLPDYLIIVLDNEWTDRFGREREEFDGSAGELFLAEELDPIYTSEIEANWEKQPEVVFWVKNAMGGSAFLPFNCRTIYFYPEGRMGGICNLIFQYGTTRDEMVREKLFSAFLRHMEGMAITGGYDTRIVKAMARMDYTLSVSFPGGKPVYHERLPESNDEILLTNDGTESDNAATIEELARGDFKGALTLKADMAQKLGLSKGTVETLDDLLFQLELERNGVAVEGRSDDIMDGWSDGVDSAERRIRELMGDYQEIQVQGDYRERTAARGRQRRILESILRLLTRYGEVLDPGGQQASQIRVQIEAIKQQQLRDRK